MLNIENVYLGNFLFILGSGRSGNTLLRKLLVDKYRIYIPAETYVIAQALDAFNKSLALSWESRVRLVLSAFEYHTEFHTVSRRSLAPVYEKCLRLSDKHQTFGDILKEMWEFLARDAGFDCQLAGDKTPLNMFSINMIARSFPNAHYLFISRHPYDVCSSYVKMGRYPDVESAAERWKMAHRNWLKFCTKSKGYKSFLISYESLVEHPSVVLSEVVNWLQVEERMAKLGPDVFWGDLSVYRHHADVKSDVNTRSIGKGKVGLSKSNREAIKTVIGRLGVEYGYEL